RGRRGHRGAPRARGRGGRRRGLRLLRRCRGHRDRRGQAPLPRPRNHPLAPGGLRRGPRAALPARAVRPGPGVVGRRPDPPARRRRSMRGGGRAPGPAPAGRLRRGGSGQCGRPAVPAGPRTARLAGPRDADQAAPGPYAPGGGPERGVRSGGHMAPKRVDRQARRDEILSAAVLLFAERGYAATRIEDVAAAAGIAKGSVYLYYESREALLTAVFERWAERSRAVVEAALSGERPAMQRLEELLRSVIALLAGEPGLTRVMLDLWAAGRRSEGGAPPPFDMAAGPRGDRAGVRARLGRAAAGGG